ncbi:MAG: M20 family metallopeptidase [Clostridium sp.]|nr:M20 family metallopeptidase [Clostridium sp.]
MGKFKNEAESIKDEIISIRRKLHQNPEIGYEEFNTSKLIKEFLIKEGIFYEKYAKTGVCALIKGNKKDNGKVIAIRADIDALPLEDKKKCSYASKIKGRMHGCGHDGHTSILLGIAKLINKNKDIFSGTIKLIFEPAEETTGGAKVMIEEGILKNPDVDIVYGLHMEETIDTGTIMIKRGTVNAASNPFKIVVKGKGAHGAYPAKSIDPIIVSSQIIIALQTIVSREINPINPAVVTVSYIHGGTASNIIPDEVEIKGIVRTMTKEDREYCVKRVREIAQGIAKSLRAECKIEIEESYPCLKNNDELVERLKQNAAKVIGLENVLEQKNPKMGVESFAYFANEVPSVFYFLGCRNIEKGIIHPAHSSLFDIDEESLPIGIAIGCEFIIDYLTS